MQDPGQVLFFVGSVNGVVNIFFMMGKVWKGKINISVFCLQDVSHSTAILQEDLTHLSTLLEDVLASEKLISLKSNLKNPPNNV